MSSVLSRSEKVIESLWQFAKVISSARTHSFLILYFVPAVVLFFFFFFSTFETQSEFQTVVRED